MKKVLLSFDIEEFDMPMEYGKTLPMEEQIGISEKGTSHILDILLEHNVRATFFSTAIFASGASAIIKRIIDEGHELASHGYFHSKFETSHLAESRIELGKLSGQAITGFRMPRMMPVDNEALRLAGYSYNSSLNPVYLPGRYNNLSKPRTLYCDNTLFQLPASALPVVRFPLFWLSFHNLPMWAYQLACEFTMNADNYLNIYFHPWEFTDLRNKKYGLPFYISKNSGLKMHQRFHALILWMKRKRYTFTTISDFLRNEKEKMGTPA